jgi:hypothetical protein
LSHRPDKILAARVVATCGQPMLSYKKAERRSNGKQKNTSAKEKVNRVGAPELWIQVKHHAAQFHD